MSRPVGRPALAYLTRHCMINMRMEYYIKLKRANVGVSSTNTDDYGL